MSNKKIIIGGLIVVAIAVFGGYKYGSSTATPTRSGFGTTGARIGGRGGAGGGFTAGSIISKDATSITLKLSSGGSEIVFVGSSTPIMKSVVGTSNDLTTGENITVSGTPNSDGSMNASSIQIRGTQTTQSQ
jgi:hypothetical protein